MRQAEAKINLKGLVEAGVYESEDKAINDALKLLFRENPKYRIKLAIHRYQTEKISIGKAAQIAGIPWEAMSEELNKNNIPLRLAPRTIEELRKDCETIRRFSSGDNR